MPDMIRTVMVEQKLMYEEQIAQLCAERDEARREFCQYIHQNGGVLPQHYAAARGWDCFPDKAEADANNTLFRTTDGE